MTGNEVFQRAMKRASLNDEGILTGISTQILGYISHYQREAFLRAAMLNPAYFGKTSTTSVRSASTASWNLATAPGDVAAVQRVEVAAITGSVSGVSVGTQVNLIDKRWPDFHVSPRAYIRNRQVTGYLTELGTNNSNMVTQLTIDYAELPTDVLNLNDELRLPREWTSLLELPLASLFALRDKREEEVEIIMAEYTRALNLFDRAVQIIDMGAAKPLESVPPLPIPMRPNAEA